MSRTELIEKIRKNIVKVNREEVLAEIDALIEKATKPDMQQIFEEAQVKYGDALQRLAQ